MPGRYADYAADPWTYVKGALDEVQAGTFQFFYPAKPPAYLKLPATGAGSGGE